MRWLLWAPIFLAAACQDVSQDRASHASSVAMFPDQCTISPAEAGCTDCMRFSSVATLGRDPGEGFLEDRGTIADVVRDSSGNYWVGQRDRIKVFDPNGRYLRTVGQAGDGPGEYVFAQPRLVDGGGNIHVLDVRQFRVTVLSPAEEVVETWRVPLLAQYAALFADGDRMLVAHWDFSGEGAGLPLHVLSSDGTVLRSFGAPYEETMSREDPGLRVAVDPRGNLYSAAIEEYRIDVWTPDGEMLSTITGPELNPGGDDSDPTDPEWRPRNRIRTISGLSDGVIAVVARLRRDDWRENAEIQTSPSGRERLAPPARDLSHFYFSRIDLVDARRCTVVASGVYDGLLRMPNRTRFSRGSASR